MKSRACGGLAASGCGQLSRQRCSEQSPEGTLGCRPRERPLQVSGANSIPFSHSLIPHLGEPHRTGLSQPNPGLPPTLPPAGGQTPSGRARALDTGAGELCAHAWPLTHTDPRKSLCLLGSISVWSTPQPGPQAGHPSLPALSPAAHSLCPAELPSHLSSHTIALGPAPLVNSLHPALPVPPCPARWAHLASVPGSSPTPQSTVSHGQQTGHTEAWAPPFLSCSQSQDRPGALVPPQVK